LDVDVIELPCSSSPGACRSSVTRHLAGDHRRTRVCVGPAKCPCERPAELALVRWRATLTAVSLALHLWTGRGVPAIDSSTAARFLATFTALWDEHRQPMGLVHVGVALNLAAVLVGIISLRWISRGLPPSSSFVLRFVIASGLVSFAGIALSWCLPIGCPVSSSF
jgi:hypothetical protein